MVLRRKLAMVFLAALLLPILPQGFWGGGAAAATNPFAGVQWLRNDPDSPVTQKANAWRSSRPGDAALLDVIAREQTADWIGGWYSADIMADYVHHLVTKYLNAGSVPILVAYDVPILDCNRSRGAKSSGEYLAWITRFAQAIGQRKAVVILEPDALTHTDCVGEGLDPNARYQLIGQAVEIFKRNSGAAVYIDGGDSNRNTVAEITAILKAANIARADGFFLNATVFQYTSREVAYGEAVGNALGGKHFVVDTSRNGLGPGQESWCNARDRALGLAPTITTGSPLADAFIWIKPVWQSDNTCEQGDPPPGEPFWEYALTLVRHHQQPFTDMPTNGELGEAVRELTMRGIIRGNGDGTFGTNNTTLRAQMAALLTRPMAWELNNHGNRFPDQCDGGNCIDRDLWRNVGALASYNVGPLADYRVANGYEDGTYNPRGEVLVGQTILFISRAMVYKGYWTLQADNGAYFTNIAPANERQAMDRRFLVTYAHYTQALGGIPGQASPTVFSGHEQPASRSFFAVALYRALKTAYLP